MKYFFTELCAILNLQGCKMTTNNSNTFLNRIASIFSTTNSLSIQSPKKSSGSSNNYLNERINRYIIIYRKLSQNISKDECLEQSKHLAYKLRDILTLVELIGSQSRNASIYKTNIHNKPTIYIATKVMNDNDDNILETILMKAITEQLVLPKKSKHFLIMYYYSLCMANRNTNFALANFNELAKNDIKYLLRQKNILENKKLQYNILLQSIISIGTFHNIVGYIHNDCHLGNFLYFYNNGSKGNTYYHYKLNDKNFYLKSCNYDVVINDFGFSSCIMLLSYKDVKDKNLFVDDYIRVIECFINTLSHDANMKDILDYIAIISNIITTYKNPSDKFCYLFTEILMMCSITFPELFFINVKDLPTGYVIINKRTPYQLYSENKIVLHNI
jgi:hypothetical protein